ncbi:TetR/AcrR family transcriptional regulator [Streptomyces sp. SYP-A7185]|uniref:TetR/AcrR family transcriptional regulator n=1 Tax=Streptomyces sp. SYP-A7185 TaxID=3040076 RepID=UPI0038F61B46
MASQKKSPTTSQCEVGGKDGGKDKVSLWERLERPVAAPRALALSPARIASVAVAIADAEGIDAVTMRRLATELEVAPMAAYRYVSGKDDVLELMVDTVYGDLKVPADPSDWRETMRVLAINTRELVLTHPWLSQLSSPKAMFAPTPNRLAVTEHALVALDAAGLSPALSMAVFETVNAYVYGSSYTEVSMRLLMKGQGWTHSDDVKMAMAPEFTWLVSTGRYPAYQRSASAGGHFGDPQAKFESGLDCVLDGIGVRMGI